MSWSTIGFAESFLGIVLATAVPIYLGLFAVSALRRVRTLYLAAFSLGVFFWYFSDTIGDSAYLDVNTGFSGGLVHVWLFLLAILGFLALAIADSNGLVGGTREQSAKGSFVIPVLVAIGLSIHGFGEGAGFGALAASTPTTSIIDALGGYGPGVSYVIHKVLEASVVGTTYRIYVRDAGLKGSIKRIVLLGLIFSIPSFLGEAIAYFYQFDTTYFFAAATGASLYVALRLVNPLFGPRAMTRAGAIKVALVVAAGFAAIYTAALLHSTPL